MEEFRCRPGECIECCTYEGLGIPVSLADLFRNLAYERKVKERDVTLYDVFDEKCSGFALMPAYNAPETSFIAMGARVPCSNVDHDAKICTVYGKAQYVGCGLCPEERLLPEDQQFEGNESPDTIRFFEHINCLDGVELTPERAEVIRQRRRLVSDELSMTHKLLAHQLDMTRMNDAAFQAEMRRRLRYISDNCISTLIMNVRQTMRRYVDLYVDDPEWAGYLLDVCMI